MFLHSFWILPATFLYAGMAVSAKLGSEFYCPFEIVFYRALAGAIVMAIVLKVQGIPFTTKYPFQHFVRCAAGTSCFLFEIMALRNLPLSVAQTIEYCSPLIFAGFLLVASLTNKEEKFEWPIAASILIGFSGVLLIFRPGSWDLSLAGAAYGFAGAFCASTASWFIRDLGKQKESTERTVFYFMVAGVIVGGIGTLFIPGGFYIPNWTASELMPLVGVAFSGVLAQFIWTFAWAKGHSLLNSVFQFSGILYGAIIGCFFFDEVIEFPKACGMFVVFCAGLFSTLYLSRKNRIKKDSVT